MNILALDISIAFTYAARRFFKRHHRGRFGDAARVGFDIASEAVDLLKAKRWPSPPRNRGRYRDPILDDMDSMDLPCGDS